MTNLRSFIEDFQRTIKELEEKYGVNINLGNISYAENEFRTKMEVINILSDNPEEAEKIAFENVCRAHFFRQEDYKREFELNRRKFELIGFDASRRKRPCIGRELSTGKKYIFTIDQVKNGFYMAMI